LKMFSDYPRALAGTGQFDEAEKVIEGAIALDPRKAKLAEAADAQKDGRA